jgi:hypothetical protein
MNKPLREPTEPIVLVLKFTKRCVCPACGAIARVEPAHDTNDYMLVSCPTLACGKTLMLAHEKILGWVDSD